MQAARGNYRAVLAETPGGDTGPTGDLAPRWGLANLCCCRGLKNRSRLRRLWVAEKITRKWQMANTETPREDTRPTGN